MHFFGSVITHYNTFIPMGCKCSGLFEDSPRGNVSCGRITIKFAQCELDYSVRICKNRVRSSNNLYGSYGVQMSKIQTIKRLILSKCAVQVRTSTDRTGCTNFFREKMHFLRTGVDKRFDAHKAPHLRPPGEAILCTAPEYPKWELWFFFASCLNIRRILQEGRKSGRTATEKEKCPHRLQICNGKGRKSRIEQKGQIYYNE